MKAILVGSKYTMDNKMLFTCEIVKDQKPFSLKIGMELNVDPVVMPSPYDHDSNTYINRQGKDDQPCDDHEWIKVTRAMGSFNLCRLCGATKPY